MKYMNGWIVALMLLLCLPLAACSQNVEDNSTERDGPVKVEHLNGVEPTRLTLTAEAAKRLDIQIAPVDNTQLGDGQRMVIPYSAILYDVQGNTWVYTNPEPLIFVRSPIIVDYIHGDQAFLLSGPPSGSNVVTIGAAELYGSETEFEEE